MAFSDIPAEQILYIYPYCIEISDYRATKIQRIAFYFEEFCALNDYAHLNKKYIIITENIGRIFVHVSDIDCLHVRDEFLKAIPMSLQNKKANTLHCIVNRHEDLL